jgi:hypothetical protein
LGIDGEEHHTVTTWTRGRRTVARLAAAALVATGALGAAPQPAHAAGPIEIGYTNPGSWGTTPYVEQLDPDGPDAPGQPDDSYTIYSPQQIGRNGHDHAVIVWGNGTAAQTSGYKPLFDHLTSWGFVVIAPNDNWVGSGAELLQARNLIVLADATSGNRYSSNIDQTSIGVMGHSQGAGGALVAAMDQPTHFQSVATWALPNTSEWCNPIGELLRPPGQEPCRHDPTAGQLANVTAPGFFVIAQTDSWSTLAGHNFWTTHVSGPAFHGQLRGATHFDLTTSTGYITAWFRHTLEDDPLAGVAFAGSTPEPGWTDKWLAWGWNGET